MEEPKNTAERKKVENVGRPDDDNKDPETSKLAKQGEIKTKIIDEDNLGYESKASKNKPNETDKTDAKEIKGGKTEVDLNPKTDDKVGDESDETQKSKKTTNKENKQIGAKGAGEKIVKETNMDIKFGLSDKLIEAARKVMEAKTKGVCPKCGKNPCQCAGDPKNMEEATDPRDSRPETYRPNNTGYAWDRLSTRMKSDPKDSKARKTGKQLGLKHSIKDAMGKHGPKGHLPEEEAIDEVLDTPMKKLGYIAKNAYQVATADPAKMANDPKKANAIANRVIGAKRFQKKLNKEEVEVVDEGKGPNGNPLVYADATTKARNPLVYGDKKERNPLVYRDKHRDNPMVFGKKKMTKEEVEAIDEVSLKTKINAYKAAKDPEADYSYGSKVHDQADRIHKNIVAKHGAKAGEHADRAAYGKPSTPASRSAEKAKPDVLKRDTTHPMRITKSGVAHKQDQKSNAAVIKSRLGKHGKSNIPEEVEQIDELSPATMMKYQYKSASRIDNAAQNARSMGSDKDHLKKPYGNEIRKRKKGLNLASERLAKKSMDEEVEFSEAELARIEEILKGP